MIHVVLTEEEVEEAVACARDRDTRSKERGSKPGQGFKGNTLKIHIEGALGERAVSKALDIPWECKLDTYQSVPDVGIYDVRAAPKHWYDLRIYHKDRDDRPVILVTGTPPNFILRGWLYAREAKQKKWLTDKGIKDRPPAFFVPQGELHPMDTLPEMP